MGFIENNKLFNLAFVYCFILFHPLYTPTNIIIIIHIQFDCIHFPLDMAFANKIAPAALNCNGQQCTTAYKHDN